MPGQHGLTLIELLIALLVIGVVASTGLPAWRALTGDAQVSGLVSTYLHAYHSARVAAISAGRAVTLCPLDPGGQCQDRWADTLTLFFDDDRNGRLASPADLIERVTLVTPEQVTVTFRAFRTTRHVTLRANGHYRQNGTFRFCLRGKPRGRAIVINVLGRTRNAETDCRH